MTDLIDKIPQPFERNKFLFPKIFSSKLHCLPSRANQDWSASTQAQKDEAMASTKRAKYPKAQKGQNVPTCYGWTMSESRESRRQIAVASWHLSAQ